MADTGYVMCGTGASRRLNGLFNDWVNPTNITADDTNNSYYNIGTISDWLQATNFDFSSIPADATLDGIMVRIKRYRQFGSSPYCHDDNVYLRKTSGQVGDSKPNPDIWEATWTYVEYGGPTDTWNSGLTIADIKDSGFGVELSVHNISTVARVDCIEIKIYYSVGGAAGNISKVNSVNWDNVKSVNGVAKASIAKIMDVSAT